MELSNGVTDLEVLTSKSKFNTMLLDIAKQEGIDIEDINIISTVGYLMRLMSDMHDKYALDQARINRDKFVVTSTTMSALIKHARSVSLSYGYANPARIHVQISMDRNDIIELGEEVNTDVTRLTLRADDFTVNMGEDFPFSLLYDVEVEEYFSEGKFNHRAKYVMGDKVNPIAPDVNNPDIAVTSYRQNGIDYIGLEVILYQYSVEETEFRYVDSVNSSYFDIPFVDQLATFEVFYIDQITKEEIQVDTALFIDSEQTRETIFYDLDEANIRLINKYEAGNFYPTRNSTFRIRTYQTKGTEANFEAYTGDVTNTIINDEMEVNLVYSVRSSSVYGTDKLTIDEFKEKIISYKSRRDAVITIQDMINYYNEVGDVDFNYKIDKVIDNIFDRVFNNYILMKFENNIVPSNTLNVNLNTGNAITKFASTEEYWVLDSTKYIESSTYGEGVLIDSSAVDLTKHNYRSPFNLSYNVSKNFISVYDAVISKRLLSTYAYTDALAELTYQVNYLNCEKKLDEDYRVFINVEASTLDADEFILEDDGNGGKQQSDNLISRVYFRGADRNPIGYIDIRFTEYADPYYKFEVKLTSDYNIYDKFLDLDMMVRDPNTGIYTQGTTTIDLDTVTFDIAFYNKDITFIQPGDNYTLETKNVPSITDYRLVNVFENTTLRLYTDRTQLMPFQVTNVVHEQATGDLESLDVVNVIMIKSDYFAYNQLILSEKINTEMNLINDLSEFLESNEKLRINFVNSYGISKAFKVGYNNETMDSTDISLRFTCGLYESSTVNESAIKESIVTFIRDIDFLNGSAFQIYDLIAHIKSLYVNDIEIFQFEGINNYPVNYQYIKASYETFDLTIPEVLSVGYDSNFDYNITFVKPYNI